MICNKSYKINEYRVHLMNVTHTWGVEDDVHQKICEFSLTSCPSTAQKFRTDEVDEISLEIWNKLLTSFQFARMSPLQGNHGLISATFTPIPQLFFAGTQPLCNATTSCPCGKHTTRPNEVCLSTTHFEHQLFVSFSSFYNANKP
jgi:hypothetical protein